MTDYTPANDRYTQTPAGWFRRCGRSGLKLPAISLGMWHHFGDRADHATCQRLCFDAFDLGVTHFDLANNYGPAPGAAEQRVGKILKQMPRDQMIISTKAGWPMWDGPYGDFGSRKYLLASLDQSLKRLDLEYVDIFYHHRPDPETPMAESLGALEQAVRSGKALYAGISSYDGEQTRAAANTMSQRNWPPLLIHQPLYNMFNRWIEDDLLGAAEQTGMGLIVFSPLAQGLLSTKYLNGVPSQSRAGEKDGFLTPAHITPETIAKVRRLNELAQQRGQTLVQMALAWTLRDPRVTSALIGARNSEQIRENIAAAENTTFSDDELRAIDAILCAD